MVEYDEIVYSLNIVAIFLQSSIFISSILMMIIEIIKDAGLQI
jgi:hypothetical protein